MRTVFVLTLACFGVVSTASAGPYRYYSTGYQPCYYQSYTPSYYYPQTYYSQQYATPYVAPPPSPTSDTFEADMLKYLTIQKRQDIVNKLAETVSPGFATSHASYSGQGASLYGVAPYSVKAITTTENVGVNLELADQRTARLIQGTNESFNLSSAQRQEFLATASAENARVAEINAKANAVALAQQQTAELFKAANAAPSSKTTTVVAGTGVAPVAQPNVSAARQEFLKIARQDCAQCHTAGPNMKGNFNVESVASLTRPQAKEILRRITSTKAEVVMPKPAPGQPVVHIPDDHMAAWVDVLSQVQ